VVTAEAIPIRVEAKNNIFFISAIRAEGESFTIKKAPLRSTVLWLPQFRTADALVSPGEIFPQRPDIQEELCKSLPEGPLAGPVRVIEQGEVLPRKYDHEENTHFHLELPLT
jgi:hypothetical protein